MIKYVFCIVIGVILAWGSASTTVDKDSQKSLSGTLTASLSACPATCCISSANEDSRHTPPISINDDYSNYKVSDGILLNFSGQREFNGSKTVKLRLYSTIRLLSNLYEFCTGDRTYRPIFNHNFTKYTCGYYVYALEHILI